MDSPKTGIDLERELTCSICTELLYQPLTLLDCLHTFCGSCLKEWFTFQAATIERSPSPPPPDAASLTCPSCRSAVRDTRHSATVVSLLEMFVAANPTKARSEEEKADMASKYQPGDQVLPKIKIPERTAEDDEDRRLLNRVREMSMRDVSSGGSHPPSSSRHRRPRDSRSADGRSSSRDHHSSSDGRSSRRPREGSGSHRPRRDDDGRRSADRLNLNPNPDDEDGARRRRSEERQRRVEHQSSLRSLIGSAGMSERDIEREIEEFARQIQEEGLLNGLDLDNIDLDRDDELSRRITEAYRRRQRERSRNEPARRSNTSAHSSSSRQHVNEQPESRQPTDSRSRTGSRPRTHVRSRSATGRAEDRSRPPPSMSATLDARGDGRSSRRRTGSTGRSGTLPSSTSRPSSGEPSPASRSQTDLTLRTQPLDSPTGIGGRPSFGETRSSSMPTATSTIVPSTPAELPASNGARLLSFASRVPQANFGGEQQRSSTPPELPGNTGMNRSNRPAELAVVHTSIAPTVSSPTGSGHQRKGSQLYPEPSITCARCSRPHIEYEVYYNCSVCWNGQWNMCLSCYRAGKGCLHWLGFGYRAQARWELARQQGDTSLARSHTLSPCRYQPPPSTPGGADGRRTLTRDDPKERFESGTFCARCFAWTNACYWQCGECNEGEWGFCNNCVNQGKSCTHQLLPLAHESSQVSSSPQGRPTTPRSPARPPAAAIQPGPSPSDIWPFKPLVFNTTCDICQDKIPPTHTRFHCPNCTSSLVSDGTPGDYDICSPCYRDLVSQGRLSAENGHAGWRRCLNGHRMTVIAFADRKHGQQRYVDRDLVGGRRLWSESHDHGGEHAGKGLLKWSWTQGDQKMERLVTRDVSATAPTGDGAVTFATTFPPNGGLGQYGMARWPWYPQSGNTDELLFPKGAEVIEISDVNGEWLYGVYMGAKGMFPSSRIRVRGNMRGSAAA